MIHVFGESFVWGVLSGKKRKSMTASFIESGCDVEQLSLKMLTERLRTVTFKNNYQYLDLAGIQRELHMQEVLAKEVQATCINRGGMWVRPSPNAPHVKELNQYYVCVSTTSAETHEYREHISMFTTVAPSEANVSKFLSQLESRLAPHLMIK